MKTESLCKLIEILYSWIISISTYLIITDVVHHYPVLGGLHCHRVSSWLYDDVLLGLRCLVIHVVAVPQLQSREMS